MEDKVGLGLLIDLFKHLTKKEVNWKQKPNQENPFYTVKTAAFLMKNREINSKLDHKKKQSSKITLLKDHFENVKQRKTKLRLKQFIRRRKKDIIQRHLNMLKDFKDNDEVFGEGENNSRIKMISLKRYQKNNEPNSKNTNFFDKTEKFLISIGEMIEKNFKHEVRDNNIIFVASNFHELLKDPQAFDQDFIHMVFKVIRENSKEIIEKITNNIFNFYFFFSSFSEFIFKIDDNPENYKIITQTLQSLGESFMTQEDDEFFIVFMENNGFLILKDYCVQRTNKIKYYAAFMNSLIQKEAYIRVKIICKLKEVFEENLNEFFTLLAWLSVDDIDDPQKIYFDTLLYYALIAFKSSSVFNIVNSLKILSEIVKIDTKTIALELLDKNLSWLFKCQFWEIDAILLIISSFVLQNINQKKYDLKIEDEDVDRKAVELKEEDEELLKQTQESFLNLINRIFNKSVNKNIIKIGIIYLSPVLKLFPDLTEHYLEVLLSLQYNNLQILLSDENIDLEEPIVRGSRSFFYKQRGAHLRWDCLEILKSLKAHFKKNDVKYLDRIHCFILEKNLVQKIEKEKYNDWLEDFKKIEELMIESFKIPKICERILGIFKLFLSYDFIISYVIENSFDRLFDCLSIIYSDTNTENATFSENQLVFRNFLKFLSLKQDFFEFVYQIIKKFSEINFYSFRKSNLFRLMNEMASKRREKLFGQNFLKIVLA